MPVTNGLQISSRLNRLHVPEFLGANFTALSRLSFLYADSYLSIAIFERPSLLIQSLALPQHFEGLACGHTIVLWSLFALHCLL